MSWLLIELERKGLFFGREGGRFEIYDMKGNYRMSREEFEKKDVAIFLSW